MLAGMSSERQRINFSIKGIKMNIFTKHPQSIGETYLQHLCFASLFGIKMVAGGLACMIHAIFPFVFQNTGSRMAIKLSEKFTTRATQGQTESLNQS